MNDVIVQLGYTTRGGGVVPLAASRNRTLVRIVARHILGELSESKYNDELLDMLAKQERNHLSQMMSTLGIGTIQDRQSAQPEPAINETAHDATN
jgi:hypothetical protein